MMNKKLILAAILVIMIFSIPVSAKTGMVNMLNLTGARQVSMGETAILTVFDPFNLEYNASSIAGMTRGKIGISYNSFIQDRQTNSLSAIFPAKGYDFGILMRLSSVGDIEARGEIPSTDPLYTFNPHEFAFKTYGVKKFNDKFSIGVSLGYLMGKIDIYRASSFGLGLSGLYKFKHGLTGHASIENIGSKFAFISEKLDMPSMYRVGAQYQKDALSVTADYVNSKSGDSHIHLGAEYLLQQVSYIRAGYQTGYDNKDFSAGLGFLYKNFRIDYAFVPYKSDLGNSHRFSVIVDVM